jgi:hypothetical protein
MPGRTFTIGDIHGDIDAVHQLLASFPELTSEDTLVFVGDYLDRGPCSEEVVRRRAAPRSAISAARVDRSSAATTRTPGSA